MKVHRLRAMAGMLGKGGGDQRQNTTSGTAKFELLTPGIERNGEGACTYSKFCLRRFSFVRTAQLPRPDGT